MINLTTLYQFQLKYLLDYYISLYVKFFNKIWFSYIYFDYKKLKYQSDITKIIIYCKTVKKEQNDIYKAYNNKKHII